MTVTNIVSHIARSDLGAFALAVLTAVTLAGEASAQATYPNPPTNVNVVPADTEATITWDAPVVGENGCAPTD